MSADAFTARASERPVHPRLSVSQISTFGWTVAQDLAFYQASGIATAGILHAKLLPEVGANIDAIRDAGLACSCVVAGEMGASLIAQGDDGNYRALDVLEPGIDAAAALGGVPCYFTSGATPARMNTDEAYTALVAALGPVSDRAGAAGIRLAIENNSTPTRDNGFIHTLADAADLSRDTGIGICVELQNCWMERHLARLFAQHVDRFVVVQVSDFAVGEAARLNRRVPGDGTMPLEWLLERLLDAGYQGLFEIEILGPAIEQEGYAAAIGRSVDWLTERLDNWGV